MAYSNSVEQGQSVLDGGTTFVRGLMWTGIALVAFVVATAFDYKWLKTFAWPLYVLQLGLLVADAGHRQRRRRLRSLGRRSGRSSSSSASSRRS